MTVKTIVTGIWKENCHIISNNSNEALIIDPGADFNLIEQYISSHKLTPIAIINTHAHHDHVGAVEDCKIHFDIPFYLHSKDNKLLKQVNLYLMLFGDKNLVKVPKVDFDLKEVEVLKLGNFTIKIIETPGHTKGGVCFLIDNLLFSGDTLLKGNIGRTDLPEANKAAAIESLKKITQLPANTIVYSGHGSVTTIGEECKNNVPLQELLNGTSN